VAKEKEVVKVTLAFPSQGIIPCGQGIIVKKYYT
jgi:hypothetical protein